MKQKLPLSKVYQLFSFGPVVFITSADKGKANIMPISWLMPVDFEPPKLALIIGDQSHTFKLVRKSKELVINIPSKKMIKKVIGCGNCSGSRVDKFKRFDLTPLPSEKIRTPGIAECVANIECKISDDKWAGKYNIFIVEAVNCQVEKGLFNGCYRVDRTRFSPLLYFGNNFFSTPKKAGKCL